MTDKQKAKKKETNRLWYQNNKAYHKAKVKKWISENKESRTTYLSEYTKTRTSTDPLFKLSRNLRSRLYSALKYQRQANYKSSKPSTQDMIGCTFEFFKEYIENLFKPDMTWYNVHIDHIIPLASATTEEELIGLMHYTNCQPLWPIENLSKGCRL